MLILGSITDSNDLKYFLESFEGYRLKLARLHIC